MRFIPCTLIALLTSSAMAADLRFTAGAVTNTTATLSLAGPNSTYVEVQRLNKTNQTWQVVTNVTLSGSGSGTVNAALFAGDYGFFRAKTTNSPVQYSTNAFGSVITVLTEGWSLIGNMFASKNLSFLPVDPRLGNSVFKWDNEANSYDLSTYEEDDWGGISWNNNYVIEELEAVFYYNGTTNPVKWLTQGIFGTNSFNKAIPQNWSMHTSHRYQLTDVATLKVDTLDTNNYGGLSLLPVRSPGFDPEAQLNRLKTKATVTYIEYILTNAAWRTNGTQTTVPLHLSEGLFLYKPTNATWTVTREIW